MSKFKFAMMPAAVALLVAAGSVNAAENAVVTITANIQSMACTVSASNTNIDLGTYVAADVLTTGVATPNSVREFSLTLTDCSSAPQANNKAQILVAGNVLGGQKRIFNDDTMSNVGITLDNGANPVLVGDKILVATAPATSMALTDFQGKSVKLKTGLVATSLANTGLVSAPITFSFIVE